MESSNSIDSDNTTIFTDETDVETASNHSTESVMESSSSCSSEQSPTLNAAEAPYGYRSDGLPRLKCGRKSIYTPEERRQRRNAYHRDYYRRTHSAAARQAQQLQVPTLAVAADHENYVLQSLDEYIAFIDKCMSLLVHHKILSRYNLNIGYGSGADIHPLSA